MLLEFTIGGWQENALVRYVVVEGDDVPGSLSRDEFMAESASPTMPGGVRWIHVVGRSMRFVLQLANKFNLHPLEVADLLSTCTPTGSSPHDVPQLEMLGNSVSLRLCVPYLATRQLHNTRKSGKLLAPGSIEIGWTRAFVFLRLEGSSTPGVEAPNQEEGPSTGSQGGTLLSVVGDEMGGADFQLLVQRLMQKTSKLRINDARYLLYSLVDTIVDEVLLLVRVLEAGLRTIEQQVMETSRFKFKTTYEVRRLKTQSDALQAWLARLREVTIELRRELPQGGSWAEDAGEEARREARWHEEHMAHHRSIENDPPAWLQVQHIC